MNQPTVVKLLPTDLHAAKILRGDTGRVYSELGNPTAGHENQNNLFLQEADAGMGSPYLDAPGNISPVFSMTSNSNTQWSYLASPPCVVIAVYQPPAASNPHPATCQTTVVTSPAASLPTYHQYGTPAAYYSSIPAYDLSQQQACAGYPQQQTSLALLSVVAYATEPWPPSDLAATPEISTVPGEMGTDADVRITPACRSKEGRKRGGGFVAAVGTPAVGVSTRFVTGGSADGEGDGGGGSESGGGGKSGRWAAGGKAPRSGAAQVQGQSRSRPQARGSGSGSGSRSEGAVTQQQSPVVAPPSGSASASASVASGSGRKKAREVPPVIANGSGGGAGKKERASLVVDGSVAGKKGRGGHHGSRY